MAEILLKVTAQDKLDVQKSTHVFSFFTFVNFDGVNCCHSALGTTLQTHGTHVVLKPLV